MEYRHEGFYAIMILMVGLLFGGLLGSQCNNTRNTIGRDTQRCEVAGEDLHCIPHTARTRADGKCICALPGKSLMSFSLSQPPQITKGE